MLLLCAESSEALLGFAAFGDGGCFLIAQVAEAGLENSINIISAYFPVTSGFKQIKTFIGIMCRCKTQLSLEASLFFQVSAIHALSRSLPLCCQMGFLLSWSGTGLSAK